MSDFEIVVEQSDRCLNGKIYPKSEVFHDYWSFVSKMCVGDSIVIKNNTNKSLSSHDFELKGK